MAEKRTKSDQLQRSIQRTDRRMGARAEEDFLERKPGKATVISGSAGSQKKKGERESGEAA